MDDSEKRRPGADGGAAEGEIMGDDDAPLAGCAFENLFIRSTHQEFFGGSAQIAPARSKACDDVWSDVVSFSHVGRCIFDEAESI